MEVRVERLTRRFGKLAAVDRASFRFGAGEVYGFIGPNGAGKTTTLRILATLDVPTQGDAFFDDDSVVHYPDRIRRTLGYMPDTLDTYPDTTVTEYIDFFARAYGLRGKERQRRVDEIMSFTDLHSLAEKLTDTLSKGMKQRLSLGRALIHDPQVLLLDEPAAGLDPRARIELRELIRALAEQGKAILVSSHILTELAEICDGIVIIEKGRILQTGSVSDIERSVEESTQSRAKIVIELAVEGEGRAAHVAALERFLAEQPGIEETRFVGDLAEFTFAGGRTERAALLRALVERGLPIAQFRLEKKDLEDIFLHVTKGEVS